MRPGPTGYVGLAVHEAAAELIARCRLGEGPAFLFAPTYRLDGHTIADAAPYRSADEVEAQRERDPINRLARTIIDAGATRSTLDALQKEIETEMIEAVAYAAGLPWPDPSDALSDVQDLGAPE